MVGAVVIRRRKKYRYLQTERVRKAKDFRTRFLFLLARGGCVTAFPNAAHDDMVDAFTQLLALWYAKLHKKKSKWGVA